MSRHRRAKKGPSRWRRCDLLAEIARLNTIVAALQEDRAHLLREVAAPGSSEPTALIVELRPVSRTAELPLTDEVPVITPDGARITASTGPRRRPSWAHDT